MPRTVELNVYQINELSPESKAKALDRHRYLNVEDDWHFPIEEGFKESTKLWDVDRIRFSGFWSQGDGAMFEGRMIHAPELRPLGLSQETQDLIDAGEIDIDIRVAHRGHYYHERCSEFYLSISAPENPDAEEELYNLEDAIIEDYYSRCKSLYRSLEKYYDELSSDERVEEAIIANEIEFLVNGERF